MEVLIVNQEQVAELLPMPDCIDVMERVLKSLSAGECLLPLRQIMWLAEKTGALGLMPSYWKSAETIGVKAVTFFPGNEGTERDTHQGAVLVFEAQRGCLLAIVDATSITAIRTAAVSGVATKLLAREDAGILAIIGSGVQARAHLQAMMSCREIRNVRVSSKTLSRAEAFAAEHASRLSIPIEAVSSAREAVDGADIICTTTSSQDPVVEGDWIRPGAHINAVGSSVATARELDSLAVQRSRLFVDRLESAVNEAGDFILAKAEGAVNDDHIVGEIGEVLVGRVAGRKSAEDITLFKSVGLAVEDLAAALHVYQKAKEAGVGVGIEFGGRRLGAR